MQKLRLSALDLVPVLAGDTVAGAIDKTVATAQWADKADFARYLVAEHHNTSRLASASTAIIIQRILDKTERIEVGAGGVMLPNHSPLQVAETYATLDVLYPGRVDLGIGRAPGTDPVTASLITRKHYMSNQEFYDDIMQICSYFDENQPEEAVVRAYPGAGAKVHPIILGSTSNSAYVAAAAGLPYAYATHFSKSPALDAVDIYREKFHPSKYLNKPYVIISLWNFAAETAEEGEAYHEQMMAYMMEMLKGKRSEPGSEPPPLSSGEKILLTAQSGGSLKGSPDQIREQWKTWNEKLSPDELMLATFRTHAEDIIKSLEIVKHALA